MKNILLVIVSAVFLFMAIPPAHAKASGMIFWYPGEAGSTSEAEPVLAAFTDYIRAKSGIEIRGTYFNDVPKGLVFIKGQKPSYGIISEITLDENKDILPPFSVIARTKPMPDGMTTERFSLVGYRTPETNGNGASPAHLTVLSSVPVSVSYLRSTLFPNLKGNITVQTTPTLLMSLKKMATGANPNHAALLTPMEAYTLKNLKADWTKNLVELQKGEPIPTAPLVSFKDDAAEAGKLVDVLTAMPNDPEGKDILETLRLKGFTKCSIHHQK